MKRTLARCRKYEENGISCFNEPALRDVIFAAPLHGGNVEPMKCNGLSLPPENQNSHQEPVVSGWPLIIYIFVLLMNVFVVLAYFTLCLCVYIRKFMCYNMHILQDIESRCSVKGIYIRQNLCTGFLLSDKTYALVFCFPMMWIFFSKCP